MLHVRIRVAAALAAREKSSTVQTLIAGESSTAKKHFSLLRFSFSEARLLPGSPGDRAHVVLLLSTTRPAKIRAMGKES